MPFKTNLKDLRPRAEKQKTEVTLVSGGFVNRTAFPDGKITVYPWDSSTDEWVQEESRNSPPGRQSEIFHRLVGKVSNLNGCALEDFCIGDVFTVLMASRAIEHGGVVKYTAECPHCGVKETADVRIPDELQPVSPKGAGYSGIDEITLPECGDVLGIRPLRIRDEMLVMSRAAESRARINDHIARILIPIVTINGGQPDMLDEVFNWYMALSTADSRLLEKKEDELTPHLDQAMMHQCAKCKKVYRQPLTLNTEFFRSGHFANA